MKDNLCKSICSLVNVSTTFFLFSGDMLRFLNWVWFFCIYWTYTGVILNSVSSVLSPTSLVVVAIVRSLGTELSIIKLSYFTDLPSSPIKFTKWLRLSVTWLNSFSDLKVLVTSHFCVSLIYSICNVSDFRILISSILFRLWMSFICSISFWREREKAVDSPACFFIISSIFCFYITAFLSNLSMLSLMLAFWFLRSAFTCSERRVLTAFISLLSFIFSITYSIGDLKSMPSSLISTSDSSLPSSITFNIQFS